MSGSRLRTLKKSFEASENELVVGVRAFCEAEQQNAGDECGGCDGVFASNVFDIDSVGGDDGTGYTDDGRDGVVTIDDAVGCRSGVFACVLEILGEEGVEERVLFDSVI